MIIHHFFTIIKHLYVILFKFNFVITHRVHLFLQSIFHHPATLQALGRSAKASAINLAASASRLSGSTESCSSVIGAASAPIGGQKWFEAKEAGRMKINVNGDIISKPIDHMPIFLSFCNKINILSHIVSGSVCM